MEATQICELALHVDSRLPLERFELGTSESDTSKMKRIEKALLRVMRKAGKAPKRGQVGRNRGLERKMMVVLYVPSQSLHIAIIVDIEIQHGRRTGS